jgi:hypothetical protein
MGEPDKREELFRKMKEREGKKRDNKFLVVFYCFIFNRILNLLIPSLKPKKKVEFKSSYINQLSLLVGQKEKDDEEIEKIRKKLENKKLNVQQNQNQYFNPESSEYEVKKKKKKKKTKIYEDILSSLIGDEIDEGKKNIKRKFNENKGFEVAKKSKKLHKVKNVFLSDLVGVKNKKAKKEKKKIIFQKIKRDKIKLVKFFFFLFFLLLDNFSIIEEVISSPKESIKNDVIENDLKGENMTLPISKEKRKKTKPLKDVLEKLVGVGKRKKKLQKKETEEDVIEGNITVVEMLTLPPMEGYIYVYMYICIFLIYLFLSIFSKVLN